MHQQPCLFTPASGATPLPYLLAMPRAYSADNTTQWPLLLFLHGRGERGNDFALLKQHGIPRRLDEIGDFPFITASPQCPDDSDWSAHSEALIALVDELLATYHIDPTRVYLTGLSMGGRGSWQLAMLYPHRFAAMAPICGRIPDLPNFLEDIARLRHLPIWVFHGAQDPIVPIANSEKLVAALRACGGNVRFTVYPNADHDSWTETYANPELYTWLLAHTQMVERRA